jgi:voltage-dependent calcium channel L type alpha-1D
LTNVDGTAEKEQLKQNIVVKKMQMAALKKKQKRIKLKKKQSMLHGIMLVEPALEGRAFGIIDKNNSFRRVMFRIVTNKYFDYFIIVMIVLSAVQLSLDSPLDDPHSTMKKSLFWIDVATTVVFILEALMKNLTYGFLMNGQWSYIRQPWNILDFIIIIFSVMSIGPFSDNFKTIKIFRILRSMRLISRNEQLKVAVRALFFAIPNILNITIIMLLFFLIFGVIAVSYFKGKFFYCSS